MKKIRFGVFETNSSSTHSICMCTAEEYEKFKKGEMFYNDNSFNGEKKLMTPEEKDKYIREQIVLRSMDIDWNNNTFTFNHKKYSYKDYEDRKSKQKELLTPEILDKVTQEEIDNYLENCDDIMTYEEFNDSDYLETYSEEYTTPGGEHVISFGRFGYDG